MLNYNLTLTDAYTKQTTYPVIRRLDSTQVAAPGDNRKWQLEHRSATSWVGGGESAGALLPHRAAAPASVTRYHEAAPL